MSFAEWLNDRRWAANVRRARAWRRSLTFIRRVKFDAALRHPLNENSVIAYPDAFYEITIEDLTRAMWESRQ